MNWCLLVEESVFLGIQKMGLQKVLKLVKQLAKTKIYHSLQMDDLRGRYLNLKKIARKLRASQGEV